MNCTQEAADTLADKIKLRGELLNVLRALDRRRPEAGVGKCKVKLYAGPIDGHLDWVSVDMPKALMEQLLNHGDVVNQARAMLRGIDGDLAKSGISIEGDAHVD